MKTIYDTRTKSTSKKKVSSKIQIRLITHTVIPNHPFVAFKPNILFGNGIN